MKFLAPQNLDSLVDVSWISPLPGEQELIFNGWGTAVYSPQEDDNTSFDVDRSFLKTLIVDSGNTRLYIRDEDRDLFVSALATNVSKLQSLGAVSLMSKDGM